MLVEHSVAKRLVLTATIVVPPFRIFRCCSAAYSWIKQMLDQLPDDILALLIRAQGVDVHSLRCVSKRFERLFLQEIADFTIKGNHTTILENIRIRANLIQVLHLPLLESNVWASLCTLPLLHTLHVKHFFEFRLSEVSSTLRSFHSVDVPPSQFFACVPFLTELAMESSICSTETLADVAEYCRSLSSLDICFLPAMTLEPMPLESIADILSCLPVILHRPSMQTLSVHITSSCIPFIDASLRSCDHIKAVSVEFLRKVRNFASDPGLINLVGHRLKSYTAGRNLYDLQNHPFDKFSEGACAHLERVRVLSTDAVMMPIRHSMPRLTSLEVDYIPANIGRVQDPGEAWNDLFHGINDSKLTTFRLRTAYPALCTLDNLLSPLSLCANLSFLDLTGAFIKSPDCMQDLSWPRVRRLKLRCPANSSALLQSVFLRAFPSVTKLWICTDMPLQFLGTPPPIVRLSLFTKVDQDLKYLFHALPLLRAFTFQSSLFTAPGLEHINNLRHLKKLSLKCIDNFQVEFSSHLRAQLQVLLFSRCKISNDVLSKMVKGPAFVKLEELSFFSSDCSAKLSHQFIRSLASYSLTECTLTSGDYSTDSGRAEDLRRFRQEMPLVAFTTSTKYLLSDHPTQDMSCALL